MLRNLPHLCFIIKILDVRPPCKFGVKTKHFVEMVLRWGEKIKRPPNKVVFLSVTS